VSDATPPKRRVKYVWKPKGVPILILLGLLPVAILPSLLAWRWLIPALGGEFTSVVGAAGAGATCGIIAWATLINCRPDDRRSWITAAIAALAAAVLTGTGIVWGGLVTLVGSAKGNVEFIRWTIFLGGLVPGVLVVLATAFLFGRQPVADRDKEVPDVNDH
jgi:MFS family permease